MLLRGLFLIADEGLEQTCQRLFNDSAVGKFFKYFLNDKEMTVQDEMVDLYVSDFIHMRVRCGQDGMQEVSKHCLGGGGRRS
jgi:hypothetical protein